MSHIDHWDDPEDLSYDEVIHAERFDEACPYPHELVEGHRLGADRQGNVCRHCGTRTHTLAPLPVAEWQRWRDHAAEMLERDPGWKAGGELISFLDAVLKRQAS